MSVQKGFVLTAQNVFIERKSCIELWVSTETGPARLLIEDNTYVVFVESSSIEKLPSIPELFSIQFHTKPVQLKTFESKPVHACYLTSPIELKQFVTILNQYKIKHFESDIKATDRFLMERFIYGSLEFSYATETAHGNFIQYNRVQCRKSNFVPTLSYVSLDIECSEKGVLYSIGLASRLDNRVLMIGEAQPTAEINIQWVDSEKALIIALIEWFQTFDPDIITGWSVVNFDFNLLCKRAAIHNVEFRIGRGQKICTIRQSNQSNFSFLNLPGRVVLDGIDSLKSAAYHFPSWSLENVSQALLQEGKAIHNVHDRMSEINHMYRHDKLSLAKYNLQDCVLVNRIFEKTNLIPYLIERMKLTGLTLDRAGGSVAAFTNLYLPKLHRQGYVAPNLDDLIWQASPGGFVMESIPGLYDSVIVLDFKSLYPSIIRTFLIDPLGLIEGLKLEIGNQRNEAVEGFKGGKFHREHHILPKLIEELWLARDKAKKANNQAFSQAIKIIMNSFYGVLGATGCRFFDVRLASSITMRGHQIMKQTKSLIEMNGFRVIYGDTDSTFVSLDKKCSQSEADEIGQALTRKINDWWNQKLQTEFNLPSCLEIEYETHFHKFLMPTIRGSETGSKKRYSGLVVNKHGEQSIIFKGLESARNDWTDLAHQFQKQLYSIVFNGQDATALVRETVEATLSGQFDEQLVYQKRLRRKLRDYEKNIPPQVRAARQADEMNLKLGRQQQYQNRGTIRYIITVNGPEAVEYSKSNIDYDHYIDKQLKPIADAILPFVGLSFDEINAPQLGLF
jgi:DNA polymerase-2